MTTTHTEGLKPEFGDYVIIEQKRFGVPNEMYQYKVVGMLRSNTWVDVPVQAGSNEAMHEEMADVITCICCGIDERKVVYHRISDVNICRRPSQPSEAAIRNAALEEAKKAACQYAEKEAGSIDQQGYHRAAANNIFHIIHALQSSNASDAAQPVKGE